jgi:HEAT repeat protein
MFSSLSVRLVLVVLLFGVSTVSAQQRAADPQAVAQSQPPAQSAPAPEPALAIAYEDGLLTVNVRAAALTGVLEQVSAQTGIAFVQVEDLSGERITAAFAGLPLLDALHELLKNCDSFFFLGVNDKPPASISVAWVYPRGHGRGVAPVPPSAWASTDELRKSAASIEDVHERAAAYQSLIERGGAGANEALTQALGDADPLVRGFALNSATSKGMEVSRDVLLQALSDPSKDVRFLALQAMALRSDAEARAAAEFARNDPDPLLRSQAEQMLRNFAAQAGKQPTALSPAPYR